ncbi:MAG: alpha/beta hydrolase [Promethearchaeota archaeon]
MKFKEIIVGNKKRTIFLIGVALIFSGIIPLIIFTYHADLNNPYTIKEITLSSEDGTKIQALIYTPEGESEAGIVVAHGFCSNKQYMQPMSIELVKRGFTVISIDFRGHGSSEGELPALRRTLENNPIDDDLMSAVEYLENKDNIKHIGLVGHSMGGAASQRVSINHPNRIDAVVSIGMIDLSYKIEKISNILMAIGRYEQIFSQDLAIDFLQEYTGKDDVQIGQLYGDFEDGDATKVVLGETEHLGETVDATILYDMVQWFEQAFNGKRANNIIITATYHLISFIIALVGLIILCFLLTIYISNRLFRREKQRPLIPEYNEKSLFQLSFLYVLGALIGAIILIYPLSLLLEAIMPVSMGHTLYAFIISFAVGLILVYWIIILRNNDGSIKDLPDKIKIMCPNNPYQAILYGILIGVIIPTGIASLMHWSNNASFLTAREIGTVFGICLLFFPFLFIKEFFLRGIQERMAQSNRIKEYFSMVGLGIILENILIILLMAVTWQSTNFDLAFVALAMTALVIFSIIQQFLVTWVYMHSGRNILGSTTFLCILFGWMIVCFFPFGANVGIL